MLTADMVKENVDKRSNFGKEAFAYSKKASKHRRFKVHLFRSLSIFSVRWCNSELTVARSSSAAFI